MVDNAISIGWGTKVSLVTSSAGTIELLGYAGGMSRQDTPVHTTAASVGTMSDHSSVSKVISTDGTSINQVDVTIDVDVTQAMLLMDYLLAYRKEEFSVVTGTEQLMSLTQGKCIWSSFSLSCGANGLVTGNLSAQAREAYVLTDVTSPTGETSDEGLYDLVQYWQTGNTDVFSWSVSANQQVIPVFMNITGRYPRYFRVGPWDFTLSIETLRHPREHQEVGVTIEKLFKFLKGMRLNASANFGALNEAGRFTWNYTAHGVPSSYSDATAIKQSVVSLVDG